MQDEVIGWGEEQVPPQQDAVPSALEGEPEPESESFWQRWRGRIATAVVVVAFTAGTVAAVTLCARGWQQAETLRGLGAGRGVFTVAHCGDPWKDSSDNTNYTCTGTFARQGAPAADVSAAPAVHSVDDDTSHKAGALITARIDGEGNVYLADDGSAAAAMSAWIAATLEMVLVGATVVRQLRRWILGLPQNWILGGPFSTAFAAASLSAMVLGTSFFATAALFAFL